MNKQERVTATFALAAVLMTLAILFLCAACAWGAEPAPATQGDLPLRHNKDGSLTIMLTKAQADICQAGGGCVVLTAAQVAKMLRATYSKRDST